MPMSKRLMTILIAGLFAGTSTVIFARGGGGSAGGMGGMSSQHMSTEGMENTNGPESTDQDKGLDRAKDRMSQQGLTHEQATDTHGKKKHSHSSKKHHPSSTQTGDRK